MWQWKKYVVVAGGGLALALQLLAASFNSLGHFKPKNLCGAYTHLILTV